MNVDNYNATPSISFLFTARASIDRIVAFLSTIGKTIDAIDSKIRQEVPHRSSCLVESYEDIPLSTGELGHCRHGDEAK
jgi:hypothetical protein